MNIEYIMGYIKAMSNFLEAKRECECCVSRGTLGEDICTDCCAENNNWEFDQELIEDKYK